MTNIEKKIKTCKWCYQVFLVKDRSKHLECVKKTKKAIDRSRRGINYDKTGGQINDRTVPRISDQAVIGKGI
jgi:hypothetical protein